jgi:CDP-diacylglycerol---glycerol-3-phosphate 3-phosphatidyltransferase
MKKLNLPNQLTVLRILLTIILIVMLSARMPFMYTWALFIFIAASITDYYDGKIARERKIVTTFGKFWDPLADKILVCALFVFLASLDKVPVKPWMAIVVISREFLVTGLRLIAASENFIIAADVFGKIKTSFQLMTIISVLTMLSLKEVSAAGTVIDRIRFPEFTAIVSYIFTWSAVFLTLWSGGVIVWKNRKYLLHE